MFKSRLRIVLLGTLGFSTQIFAQAKKEGVIERFRGLFQSKIEVCQELDLSGTWQSQKSDKKFIVTQEGCTTAKVKD